MKFNTIGELYLWLKKYDRCILGSGSQGTCYKVGNKVYKIFNQFVFNDDYDDWIKYNGEEILKFSSICNNTYVFPKDIITVSSLVVGYVTEFVNGSNLDKLNPLTVDLDKFACGLEKVYFDIESISSFSVRSYDVLYNIMYGADGFKVVDTLEYSVSTIDNVDLFNINKSNFNVGILLFLVDGYFDDFINNSIYLKDMYNDYSVDIKLFLKEFRKALSMNEGLDIYTLSEARKSLKLRNSGYKYIRDLYY